jgi:hypothetical protein
MKERGRDKEGEMERKEQKEIEMYELRAHSRCKLCYRYEPSAIHCSQGTDYLIKE